MKNNSTKNKNEKLIPEKITSKQNICNANKDVTLEIKEEQLDISKKWMQTGEVHVYRETSKINKSFTVEVEREELVIEKKTLGTNHTDKDTEVIRIPLSEENVEFTKHRITLEDVSIYKQKIEEIKSIEATLKKEESKVRISGDLKIIN